MTTEPITIAGCDIDLTIKFVREIAAEMPQHRNLTRIRVAKPVGNLLQDWGNESSYVPVVEACSYFDAQGQPSCIVGHALHRQGVAADDLTIKQNVGSVFTVMKGGSPTDRRVTWLRKVQSYQDNGTCWQQAVRYADMHVVLE